ncbi:hypothetical protein ABIE62_001953 [Porphyrobacter sp. MBR-155]
MDVFRNAPGTHDAKHLMTKEQHGAFGFMLLATD